jgi:hypothetical protein
MWLRSFALLVILGALWVVATPAFGTPDEGSHVIRAWSVAHGQLLGHDKGPVLREVSGPVVYRNYGERCSFTGGRCFSIGSSSRTGSVRTYTGRYFPAYYFAAGLPTLATSPGAHQLDVMRLVSVLIAAALLASALVTASEAQLPTFAGAGLLLAITPTVLFLAAAVNPNGLEIAAAIGVWASGALLAVRAAQGRFSNRLVDRLGIAAIALVIARPLGPLWLALAGVVLFIIARRDGVVRLWSSMRCRWWLAGIVSATALVLAWDVWQGLFDARHYLGTPPSGSPSTWTILQHSIGKIDGLVRQMIAVFGWIDIAAPSLTFAVWFLALGGIIALAVLVASRPWALALTLAIGLTLLLPVLLEAEQVRDIGYQWQGRYTLPLAVSIPLLAGFGVSETTRIRLSTRRLVAVLVVSLTIAQVVAYWQPLRDYSVGKHGPVWFFSEAQWSPPIPSLVLIVSYLVAMLLFAVNAFVPASRAQYVSPGDAPHSTAPI